MTRPAGRAGDASGPARRLMVFGRLPEAGRSKTRLAPLLGADGAAELYGAFLDDTLTTAGRVPGTELELWVPRRPGAAGLAERYPGVRLRWQSEAELGGRLIHAFGEAFAAGAESALALGSDHPTLPPEYLERAFALLEVVDLVIGPATDGGYYAIGLRRAAWPRGEILFAEIPWSTGRVLEVTRTRAAAAGLGREELPAWYDVDEPDELPLLWRDARPESRTARALARCGGRKVTDRAMADPGAG